MIRTATAFVLLLTTLLGARAGAQEPGLIESDPDSAEADSLLRYMMPEPIRTEAEEMDLREIIQRAVEGERTKLAGHQNMTYNGTVRSILTFKKKKEVRDQVFLVYEDDTGAMKFVELVNSVKKYKKKDGEWVLDENEDESNVEVGTESSARGEDLARVPFFLRNQKDYDFTLEERTLEGNNLIFKIHFEPRSTFKPLPSGTVYIDADNYRVVHEEFSFEENPAPMIVGEIKRISRQWKELPGGEWVVSKVMAEMTLQGGWTGVIPQRIEVAMVVDDHRFDQGYDERKFGPYNR
jgi:hypothetical protein